MPEEASVRPLADGCTTQPVGYIKGWFVDSDVRRQGVGRKLVEAAEVMRLSPHACLRPSPGNHVALCRSRAQSSRPIEQAPCSPPSRPSRLTAVALRASLDCGCARRSERSVVGTEKRPRSNKETGQRECREIAASLHEGTPMRQIS